MSLNAIKKHCKIRHIFFYIFCKNLHLHSKNFKFLLYLNYIVTDIDSVFKEKQRKLDNNREKKRI